MILCVHIMHIEDVHVCFCFHTVICAFTGHVKLWMTDELFNMQLQIMSMLDDAECFDVTESCCSDVHC